ncbi:hypothetical protein IT779_27910 [Nocardia sp. NEAU-351]|uniref:Cell division protein FtsL n=1 Tax=Nocardia bovistercoris TaxID=2785916 RepID=A0A931IGT2_9NOCA|nr:hypothetical protein [Nocardia bovistercoris]
MPAPGRVARRVQAAERVKSGAAQRAYAKRRTRAEQRSDTPALPKARRSVTAARVPFVVAIIALLGCGLALTLLLTTRAAEDSYQLGDARRLNSTLAEERAALQRQVEAADSAPELAARARELGMIPAKDPARLVVAPDGTVTVIGDPTPAQGAPAPPLDGTPTPSGQPGQAQGQGERVVPVSSVRQPTTTQSHSEYANGAQAHTPPPSPAPTQPNTAASSAGATGSAPQVVPDPTTPQAAAPQAQESSTPDGGVR